MHECAEARSHLVLNMSPAGGVHRASHVTNGALAQSSRDPRKRLASSSSSSDDQAHFDAGGVGDLGSPIDAPTTGRELTVALTRSSGSESVSASDAIETGLARTPYPQNSGSPLPSSFRELASGSVAPSSGGVVVAVVVSRVRPVW